MGTLLGISGGTGVSGLIGIYNQWSSSQLVIVLLIEFIAGTIIYSMPYLLEAYSIYQKNKNNTPAENEKVRNHEYKMKKMEYDYLLKLREKELKALETIIVNGHMLKEHMDENNVN